MNQPISQTIQAHKERKYQSPYYERLKSLNASVKEEYLEGFDFNSKFDANKLEKEQKELKQLMPTLMNNKIGKNVKPKRGMMTKYMVNRDKIKRELPLEL